MGWTLLGILHVLWGAGISHYVNLVLTKEAKYTGESRVSIFLKALTWPLWMPWYGIRAIINIILLIRIKIDHKMDDRLF